LKGRSGSSPKSERPFEQEKPKVNCAQKSIGHGCEGGSRRNKGKNPVGAGGMGGDAGLKDLISGKSSLRGNDHLQKRGGLLPLLSKGKILQKKKGYLWRLRRGKKAGEEMMPKIHGCEREESTAGPEKKSGRGLMFSGGKRVN